MQNGQRFSLWPSNKVKPIFPLVLRGPGDGVSYRDWQVAISVLDVGDPCPSSGSFGEDSAHLVSRDDPHQDNDASELEPVPTFLCSLSAERFNDILFG